jgi:hypothetical protein
MRAAGCGSFSIAISTEVVRVVGFVSTYDGGMRAWLGTLVDVWSHAARSFA